LDAIAVEHDKDQHWALESEEPVHVYSAEKKGGLTSSHVTQTNVQCHSSRSLVVSSEINGDPCDVAGKSRVNT
jgi:hypothetical protein